MLSAPSLEAQSRYPTLRILAEIMGQGVTAGVAVIIAAISAPVRNAWVQLADEPDGRCAPAAERRRWTIQIDTLRVMTAIRTLGCQELIHAAACKSANSIYTQPK